MASLFTMLGLLVLFSIATIVSSSPFGRPIPAWFPKLRIPPPEKTLAANKHHVPPTPSILDTSFILRGGGGGTSEDATQDADEERYSRQVYTLGARAHGLVRSSTIYIDGPCNSGLVYECAKNLALSGVGSIVILSSNSNIDNSYHNKQLDDLGHAYQRAARAEIGHEAVKADDETVLMEYVKRLNPSVSVSIAPRSDLSSTIATNGIVVCIDRPYSTQVTLDDACRKYGLKFVAVETAGVYGRIFCDFGPSFQVVDGDGETPLLVPLDRVEIASDDDNLVQVHCIEGEKHDVSKGDVIQFQLSSGEVLEVDCTVVKVGSPRLITVRFAINDDESLQDVVATVNKQATSFSRVKIPETVDFVSLQDATQQARDEGSLFTPCDLEKSFDTDRRDIIFACFETLEEFVEQNGRLPSRKESDMFESLVRRRLSQSASDDTRVQSTCQAFCNCCAGKLTPIQAILGAIGAQEALKAATGLYNPVKQFLLYDCDELLPDTCGGDTDYGATGQSYILGQTLCDALANSRLFVVGAGAIGCELVKNLSAMNAGTNGSGRIIITDMDTIEKSNLSRQLLFRDADIGKFKSAAAQEAFKRFNPEVRTEVHTSKVGDEEQGPFNDGFWSKGIDSVLNALDNMEARLFIDGQCVAHQKSLIDAGTLGPKGNVQVVVPHQSESYGSSIDPPEPAIPVCTLKTFPYSISHTIQWARDLFDGCFQRRPKQAMDYAEEFSSVDVDEFVARLVNDIGEEQALETANELKQDWVAISGGGSERIENIRAASIQWAAQYAMELFNEAIHSLLRKHPIDSVDEDGEIFWSGARRIPKALVYDDSDEEDAQQQSINDNLVDFVRVAARLRIETFLPADSESQDSIVDVDEATGALRDSTATNENDSVPSESDAKTDASTVAEQIRQILSEAGPDENLVMEQAEFEKDDEQNGHVAFVTAASNLRALCYGIAPVDAMETRRVAGKIVPAMISTTAFVSALSCVELLKLLQEVPLQRHRNAFINLALPFFAYTAPMPAERVDGLHGTTYTLWDRIIIKEGKKSSEKGGISLQKFLKKVAKKATKDPESISVSTISYGPYMVYANFLHDDDEEMLGTPLVKVLKEAILSSDDDEFAGREGDSQVSAEQQLASLEGQSFVDFTIVVEDLETGEEVEVPPVRLEKRKPDR